MKADTGAHFATDLVSEERTFERNLRRVLILAPARNDAATLRAILGRNALDAAIFTSVEQICAEIPHGLGAAIIAEEAFVDSYGLALLQQTLAAEPAWSQPPLLIITNSRAGMRASGIRQRWFSGIANIVFLERPLRTATLTSAIQAALLARHRQLQVAQHLRARAQNEQRLRAQEMQLRRLAVSLEDRVTERTRELEESNSMLVAEAGRRSKAERALVQAQKMEAIGQLTGGIAHDFNNLLMAVLAGVELVRRTADDQKRERILGGIQQAANRGKTLTQQLLAFARAGELRPGPVDFGRLLDGMNVLVAGALRGDIQVDVQVQPDLWIGMADATQLELAVLNLAVNARDAMGEGGRLTVTLRNRSLSEAKDSLVGDFIELSVTDTGEGIAAEHIDRIFDPFFTTKGVGKETGLGLSQVYGFARQSGGAVRVKSAVGSGTTITLYIPRTATVPAEAPAEAVSEDLDVAGQHALLVEDNEQVAEVAGQMLEMLGFSVRHVCDAAEALRALKDGCEVDLVISDIVMPGGMSGIELARMIRQTMPGLPVLLVTGYSGSSQKMDTDVPLLRKPFSLEELRAVLKKFGTSKSRTD